MGFIVRDFYGLARQRRGARMTDMPPAPNVLLIYTDQQRWDALGANGNRDIKSPHLDALAERGTNFDHCFVQNPVCMPSRASFLTGRYPSALGITHMGVPLPESLPNFATLFGTYGYHCANIGKLHFLPHANRDHTLPHPRYGFDHLEISDEPGVYEDAYRAWVRRHYAEQLDFLSVGLPPARKVWLDTMDWADPVRHPAASAGVARADFNGPEPFPGRSEVTHSAFVAARTADYLKERAQTGQPFACIAGFYSPHAPWVVPQCQLDRYTPSSFVLPEMPAPILAELGAERLRSARHGYYAMVSEVDDYAGRLMGVLEESGQADNTIVIFTSDHGEWLGEYGRWGKGYPAHDACSRVPLLISGPGIKRQRIPGLVESIDVLPTLLELAGLPVPTTLQGRSLAPMLRGEKAASSRSSAMTEGQGWRSLRTERFRYVVKDTGEESLFEVGAPLGSYRDLMPEASAASALADHRRELITRMLAAEQPKARVWPY
jgi:arylsulfatase A-like enzyme